MILENHHRVERSCFSGQEKEHSVTLESSCDIARRTLCKSYGDVFITQEGPRKVVVIARKSGFFGRAAHLMEHGKRQGFEFDLKCWAFQKDYHQDDIKQKRDRIQQEKRKLAEIESAEKEMKLAHPEAAAAADKLKSEIEDRVSKIKNLRRTTMTIEEAECRLNDLKPKSKL